MKISCDMCLDLMPLVRDGIASEDSRRAVLAHIEVCESCKSIYNRETAAGSADFDDNNILRGLKAHMRRLGVFLLIFGAAVGSMMSNSKNVFYNFALMPLTGGVGFTVMRKKWPLIVPLIFSVSFVCTFFLCFIAEKSSLDIAVPSALMYSAVYTALACVGILISALLAFALKKEDK